MLVPYASLAGSSRPGVNVCAPGCEVALDHRAEDAAAAACDLAGDLARDVELPLVLLAAVRVRAVDHQRRREARALPAPSHAAATLASS